MQEFSSAAGRHEFKVDGREFYLPVPSVGDVEMFTTLAGLTRTEQAKGMREALVERTRPARRTWWERLTGRDPVPAALDSLGLPQTSELFKAWASFGGLVDSGESSSSAD